MHRGELLTQTGCFWAQKFLAFARLTACSWNLWKEKRPWASLWQTLVFPTTKETQTHSWTHKNPTTKHETIGRCSLKESKREEIKRGWRKIWWWQRRMKNDEHWWMMNDEWWMMNDNELWWMMKDEWNWWCTMTDDHIHRGESGALRVAQLTHPCSLNHQPYLCHVCCWTHFIITDHMSISYAHICISISSLERGEGSRLLRWTDDLSESSFAASGWCMIMCQGAIHVPSSLQDRNRSSNSKKNEACKS